jgi:hypothetical protein
MMRGNRVRREVRVLVRPETGQQFGQGQKDKARKNLKFKRINIRLTLSVANLLRGNLFEAKLE